MTNAHNSVLYCGATDDLYRRIQEHKNEVFSNSFTSRYNLHELVYFEIFSLPSDAFTREKQIKAGSRKKKIDLIESINPKWMDLFEIISKEHGKDLVRLKKVFEIKDLQKFTMQLVETSIRFFR